MAYRAAEPRPARPNYMFGQPKPPPPIPSRPSPNDDGSKGARVQLRTLCSFLLKELLNQSDTEIEEVFANCGDNLRDLYDNIIVRINNEPKTMRSKHGLSRISNIFDEYAGITISERGFQAPEGIKVFKNVGYIKADGTLAPLPTLTPKTKAPGPPSSPKRLNRFPPGTDPNDPSGIISPTSPVGKETMNWPKAQKPTGSGRGINKIPCDTKDVRIGDCSVLPPAHARSKGYRDVAMAQGVGHGRSLPKVALPGQASSSFDGQRIVTGVPDIKLDVRCGITPYESSAWVPRIDEVSKFVTTYLRHGVQDKRYNVHTQDGYVRAAILVQLLEFRKNKVDHKILELVMMSAFPRIMMSPDGTCLKAIQGHTLEWFDIDRLYEKINTVEEYVNHPLWRCENPPDQLVFELNNENHLGNWRRMGSFAPRINKRFHTMKAVRGTVRQVFGAKNVTLCVYISARALFEFESKIEMYITQGGRIVTRCGLPWSAITMIRIKNDEGIVINKD